MRKALKRPPRIDKLYLAADYPGAIRQVEKAAEKLSFLKTKSRQFRAYVLCGFGADYGKHRLSTQVEWPDDSEILLADMPPSTASEGFSFFDNVDALLETQPKTCQEWLFGCVSSLCPENSQW